MNDLDLLTIIIISFTVFCIFCIVAVVLFIPLKTRKKSKVFLRFAFVFLIISLLMIPVYKDNITTEISILALITSLFSIYLSNFYFNGKFIIKHKPDESKILFENKSNKLVDILDIKINDISIYNWREKSNGAYEYMILAQYINYEYFDKIRKDKERRVRLSIGSSYRVTYREGFKEHNLFSTVNLKVELRYSVFNYFEQKRVIETDLGLY